MENQNNRGFFDGNPKMLFVFGLVTGVALTSLLGGSIKLPTINAQGDSDVVRTFDQPTDTGSAGNTAPAELAPVTGDEHIRGGDLADAKVVLVEYSDFECPFCSRHHPTMIQLLEEFGDDVAWVYRHFPLSFHPEAEPSAIASECAGQQGKFWDFGDAMFENQTQLGDDLYLEVAQDLGLNMNEFETCLGSDEAAQAVADDIRSGGAAGVTGTPATFINGQLVSGAVPYETLADIVESLIEG